MVGVIVEHIKTHRHQLGKHSLFIGSAVKIPPRDVTVNRVLEQVALEWAGERVSDRDDDERAQAALELMAAEVTDHAERCRLYRDKLGADVRPAEGHVRLSRLIKDGYYSNIFISEPDDMLERALHGQHMEPDKDYHLMVAGLDAPQDIKIALDESSRLAVVKCGGDLDRRFLPLAASEVQDVAASIADIIADNFKTFSVFVAMTEREDPLLAQVPREGARVFWVNTIIPMADAQLYDELKLESPASAEYHRYQPHVIGLLEARHSGRHLLCREPGSFNEFFARLHGRLVRQRHRRRPGKRDLTVLRGGPFRFLDFFDVEDDDFYFGREGDVQAVIEKVRENPVTTVFGKPAIGKTSLLRAGVMATLRQEAEETDREADRPWLAAYTRVGEDPTASIREAILAAMEEAGYDPDDPAGREEMWQVIAGAAEVTGHRVLVLLDQVAEYFVKLGDRVRERFRGALREALERCGDDFRLLIAIREDFVGELFELQDDFPHIMHNMHRLRVLTREQAEDAIVKPAQNFELQVERSLVNRILDDLWREGIEPVQLQIVLHSLYEGLSPGGRVITERVYDRLGGANEILDKYLERALSHLPGAEKRMAGKILTFMAGSSELKAAQPLDRILDEAEGERELVERVMAHLVDFGLLRPVGKAPHRGYELTHEVLADRIQQDLAGRQVMLRDIQDLIRREMNNHTQFGLLIGPEELKIIAGAREDLVIGPEELELIIRSALTAELDTEYWFGRITELGESKGEAIAALMRDEAPQVRRRTYELLGDHLEARLIRHLVNGLDDEVPEVRTLAATYLARLERHLLAMLENRDHRVRTLAARGLGHIGVRRAVKPLVDAFVDGAPGLRDELTGALVEIDDPRAPETLLRSLVSATHPAWSAAYALGRLSMGESDLRALQRTAELRRRPELLYALGVALMTRRSFEEAAAAFDQAEAAAESGHGREAIAEARRRLELEHQRAGAGRDAWSMFGRVPCHDSMTTEVVAPPLELAWQYNTRDHVVASPVARDHTAFIGSRDKRFYAVDTGKGTERWSFEATDRIERAAALGEDMVCFGALDGSVYALDIASGERRWRIALDSPIRSGCLLDGDGLCLGTRSGQVVRLNAADGATVWQHQAADEIASTPAAADGVLVVGCWDGHVLGLDADTGRELWRHRTGDAVSASPSVGEDIVYCGSDDHALYALDLHEGHVVWRGELGGAIRSCAALSPTLAVVGSLDGKCYALSRDDGAIVWVAATDEDIMASPAISADIVYVGSRDGALYALALDTGEIVWHHKTAYGIYSSPAIAEQTVLLGFDYYGLAAFRPRAAVKR